MRYAVNLCDLHALRGRDNSGLLPVQILMDGFISEKSPMVHPVKGYVDSGAVVLDGPVAKEPGRAEALVDVLQTVIGPRKLRRRVRCYAEGPRGGWREMRPVARKTEEDGDEDRRR